MEHPERKINRLIEYDYSQNGAYFVTICTQDRKKILSQIVGDDAHIVPKPYGQIAEKYIRNVPEIEKYIIMPDHIHMIIRLDNGSMWASTPTSRKPQRMGTVWQTSRNGNCVFPHKFFGFCSKRCTESQSL